MYQEDEFLMLSGIQHFEFCRRQWALIHLEQQWAENYRTTSGEIFHKRAHNENIMEKRGDTIILRGLKVASPILGMSGQCDVVELHSSSNGIKINNIDGKWKAIPIEYKRGNPKEGIEDQVQLCAQAICLEEMLLTEIEIGYLFYGESRRREKIEFSRELRNHVIELCSEMHETYEHGHTPKVKTSKKCNACSLKEICLPKLNSNIKVDQYIEGLIE